MLNCHPYQSMGYVFFFYAASFVLLGVVCFTLLKRAEGAASLPWWWLGLFGLVHGLNEWMDMVAWFFWAPPLYRVVWLFVMALSFIFLMEFARRGSRIVFGKTASPALYIWLLALASWGRFAGWPETQAVLRFFFGFLACAWSAVVLWFYRHKDPAAPWPLFSRLCLKTAACAMFLAALTTGLMGPPAAVFPASVFNADVFCALSGFPIQIGRGVVILLAAAALGLYAVRQGFLVFIKEDTATKRRFVGLCVLCVLFSVFLFYLGWEVVDRYGERVESREKKTVFLEAKFFAHFVRMSLEEAKAFEALVEEPEIIEFFKNPNARTETEARQRVSRFRRLLPADFCYAAGKDGIVLLSAQGEGVGSLIGRDESRREYFRRALTGVGGVFLMRGPEDERGLYAAYPVYRSAAPARSDEIGARSRSEKEERTSTPSGAPASTPSGAPASTPSGAREVIGVAAARISVFRFENYFRSHEAIFLVDPQGIVFAASRPEWVSKSAGDILHRLEQDTAPAVEPANRLLMTSGAAEREGWLERSLQWAPGSAAHGFYFASADIEGLKGWRLFFGETRQTALSSRFVLTMVFLSFFLLIVIVALFVFGIFLDSLRIAASEAVYKTLVEASADAIQLFDDKGRCISVNENGLKFLRCARLEVLGHFLEDFWPKEYKGRIQEGIARVLSGAQESFEARRVFADNASMVGVVTLTPIFEPNGRIRYFVGVSRDVTEERRSRERLMQSCKMETVYALATGVCHEFNNVLAIILGNAELAAAAEPAAMKKALEIIAESAKRGGWIVKTMVDLSGRSAQHREWVDVEELLKQNLLLLGNLFSAEDIVVETVFKKAPRIYANPGQLSQVFVNIMMNARDAMAGVPEKKLTVSLEPSTDGESVTLVIKDTGRGIKEEIKSRIFGPFVTTKGILGGGKGQEPGTGLGLFIAYGIIKQHNGVISVESEEGRGAAFTITFPVENPNIV